ncbi:aspartyl-phosphate phosphatase Spo0E family protein [Clostridium tyrobutyricum]|uniref:aspartyl-phosphate phosphatase Spo0E family protein n=1 Tax=Clostridium tyrobutyricum TaxID=1519 RepID=UPI002B1FC055|nr:aspartyl-phosphate phosphatase Spo0E family protein [Clostridium tyrobutyricum]MEA5009050.1 aspartyl-phosphate phosphatase Spo0E family protein [Clostridium tyrobutyricum]
MVYIYENSLSENINLLRQKLEYLIIQNNLKSNEEIVRVSQKLDKLITTYYNQKCI